MIISGFSQVIYIPISDTKVFDLALVGFVFAVLIGGYRVGIPLAILWSVVTYFNLDPQYSKFAAWELMIIRTIFGFALVFFYNLSRKLKRGSPYNVYKAIVGGVIIKAIVGFPFELFHRGWPDAVFLRGKLALLEILISCVFMGMLIKHLRQVHILNGVRKRGEQK